MTRPLNTHEAACLANAVSFTAVRGRAVARVRHDFPCMADALAYASGFGDGKTMIYAVTDTGSSAHITNA